MTHDQERRALARMAAQFARAVANKTRIRVGVMRAKVKAEKSPREGRRGG